MKSQLNTDTWKRKKHFNFFKNFDNPFYNICSNIEVTELHKNCKEKGYSFFLGYLYLSIKAVNEIEEFKYRIENDNVVIYDTIHPYSTILNTDNTFKFCDFIYSESFIEFNINAKKAIKRTLNSDDLVAGDHRNDVIHYTSIPWISLTSMTHAKNFNTKDSIPKIVFGKTFSENSKLLMPLCVEVHHSLVDGYHVGQYYNLFRELVIDSRNILNQ